MKWKELSGEERYRVVEMLRKKEVPIKEICETFGVSKQTLYRAAHKADEASMAALEKQTPGRKGKTPDQEEVAALSGEMEDLRKELEQWKTKYEVAKAFLDLERKYDRGEPLDEESTGAGKKRKRRRNKKKSKRGKK